MAINAEIGILKSIWTRKTDGRWGVNDLKGLTLKPKPGYDKDFFTFESEMQLFGSRPPQNIADMFSSIGPTDFLMKQSIVPIVAWISGAASIRCIGTGFIISCSGYVVTASHVVLDLHEGGYAKVVAKKGNIETLSGVNLGILMPLAPASGLSGFRFIPFQQSWYWGEWRPSPLIHESDKLDSATDIAVCKLPELDGGAAYQPLNLSVYPFSRGEKAYAIGYALMEDIPISFINGYLQSHEFDWQLYVSTGEVTNVFPMNHVNKDVPTPGPCFDFQARIPGKMSGSPIFGAQGSVIKGVVSRSFSGEKHAYGCMIGPAMALPFGNDLSLDKLIRDGNEGMTVLRGVGL